MTDQQEAVFHFVGGRTERGYLETAPDPDAPSFRAVVNGESMEIDVRELKAVFFLRSTAAAASEAEPSGGSILAVEFSDGEVIRGRSGGFNPGKSGFYLYPADRSKNERVFVVSSAVVSTDVEKL